MIVMKFCTDIHGLQKMNPREFGDPLTLTLVSLLGQNFSLSHTMAYYPESVKLMTHHPQLHVVFCASYCMLAC